MARRVHARKTKRSRPRKRSRPASRKSTSAAQQSGRAPRRARTSKRADIKLSIHKLGRDHYTQGAGLPNLIKMLALN